MINFAILQDFADSHEGLYGEYVNYLLKLSRMHSILPNEFYDALEKELIRVSIDIETSFERHIEERTITSQYVLWTQKN